MWLNSAFGEKLKREYAERKSELICKFLRKDDRILDVGCGNPETTDDHCTKVLMKYPNYFGCDLNPPVGEKFFKANLEKDDLSKLGKFDIVLCLDVLEHFREPRKLARKLIALSRREIIVVTPVISHKIMRRFMNSVRGLLGRQVFSGHYWDFFAGEVIDVFREMKVRNIYYGWLPIRFVSKLLFKVGIVRAGIFVFEKMDST